MPRIESGSIGGGGGLAIPWKLVAVVLVIGCSAYYVWYQYERLHPQSPVSVQSKQQNKARGPMAEYLGKLNLTPEQEKQLQAAAKETTNGKDLVRAANKILTPAQKLKAKELRQEMQEKRRSAMEANKRRLQKYYPGKSLEVAKQMNKQIQEDIRRRKAAQQKPTGGANKQAATGQGGNS